MIIYFVYTTLFLITILACALSPTLFHVSYLISVPTTFIFAILFKVGQEFIARRGIRISNDSELEVPPHKSIKNTKLSRLRIFGDIILGISLPSPFLCTLWMQHQFRLYGSSFYNENLLAMPIFFLSWILMIISFFWFGFRYVHEIDKRTSSGFTIKHWAILVTAFVLIFVFLQKIFTIIGG